MVWEKIYEQFRTIVLTSRMMLISGQIQSESGVVHLVARHIADLSAELASVGERDSFPLPHGRGDEFYNGQPGPGDSRVRPKRPALLEDEGGIRIKSRDFH